MINAVNCGIDRFHTESGYDRKIILSSLPEAEYFYKKYGFKYTKTQYGLDVFEKHIKPPPVISAEIPIDDETKIQQITKRYNEYYDLRPHPRKRFPEGLLGKAGDYATEHDDIVSDPTYVIGKKPRIHKSGGTKNKRYNKKSNRHTSNKRKTYKRKTKMIRRYK